MGEELKIQGWESNLDLDVEINTSVPGISSRDQLPADLKAQTLALIEEKFPTVHGRMSTQMGRRRKQ